MRSRVRIDGISRCSFVDGQLQIRVVHTSGQYEDFPCTFKRLLDWIDQVGVEVVIGKLVDHPMLMKVEGGVVAALASVVEPAARGLKQDRQSGGSSSSLITARKVHTRRCPRSASLPTERSAGVRYCPSCNDVVQTVCSFEHGKRMYRCKRCGSIAGYS